LKKYQAKKQNNTVLIITEKPQAAEKIANALSDAKDHKFTDKNRVSYYEFNKNKIFNFRFSTTNHIWSGDYNICCLQFTRFSLIPREAVA